jgi:hypothetical protein
MVEDLCFHVVDLVQNSVAAGAGRIELNISDSARNDFLAIEVRDDGRGMDRRTLLRIQDPFFTSKSFKKVGLGIPLLKATSEACCGDFRITSRPGVGTRVRARLRKSHIDCPPLGNLEETLLSLLVTLEKVDIRFSYRSGLGAFSISSAEARVQAEGLHLSHPDVYRFLKNFIHEGLGAVLAASG